MELLDLAESPAHLVKPENREVGAQLVILGLWAPLESPVQKVLLVLKVVKDLRVSKAHLESMARLVRWEMLVLLEAKVDPVHRVVVVWLVLLELVDLKVL